MRFSKKKAQTEKPVDPNLWKPNGDIDVKAIDKILKIGLRGSSYIFAGRIYSKNCEVKLQPGKTKDDIIAFFSTIQPCPAWDAFVGAESKGFVRIIAPVLEGSGLLETLCK